MSAKSPPSSMPSLSLGISRAARLPLESGWLLASSLLWFLAMLPRPLYEPDEGRYAEIPREMLASGDWIVPHLNGFVYIEKPPLQYWMTSLVYSVFGVHEWSARLWTTLAGWLTVVIAAAYMTWHRGHAAALRTWTFGITSLIWMLVAHQLTLDTSLTFFTTAALLAYCQAQSTPRRWLNYAMWIALGCAVLTKGFVALVLPAAAFAIYCIWMHDRQRWRTLHLWRGAIVLACMTAPWMISIQLRVPEFFDFFVVREHFLRYLTPISERSQPWWFFIPLLLVGTLPWSIIVLRPLFTGWRDCNTQHQFSDKGLLWISAVLIFLFFSASHSKLVPYILPMVPLLWILAADTRHDLAKDVLRSSTLSLLLAVCGAVALTWVLVEQPVKAHVVLSMRGYLGAILVLIAVGAIAGLSTYRHSAKRAMLALGATWMLAAAVLEIGPTAINNLYSAKEVARTLVANGANTAPVFSVDIYDQTLTFYLGHPVRLVRYRGELDFGIARDPAQFIPTLNEFIELWNATPKAFAVVRPSTYDELVKLGVPMRLLTKNSNMVAVARK